MDGLKGLVLSQIELTLIQNLKKIMYAQNSKNQTYLLQDLVMYICVQTVKPKEKNQTKIFSYILNTMSLQENSTNLCFMGLGMPVQLLGAVNDCEKECRSIKLLMYTRVY